MNLISSDHTLLLASTATEQFADVVNVYVESRIAGGEDAVTARVALVGVVERITATTANGAMILLQAAYTWVLSGCAPHEPYSRGRLVRLTRSSAVCQQATRLCCSSQLHGCCKSRTSGSLPASRLWYASRCCIDEAFIPRSRHH